MAEKKERTREKELAMVEKEKRLNKLKEEVLDRDHHNLCLRHSMWLECEVLDTMAVGIAHICINIGYNK